MLTKSFALPRCAAADPIVTRSRDGRLQVIAVQRRDTAQWALPGGMVADGEAVSAAVKREFEGEAGSISDPAQRELFRAQVTQLFEKGKQIYRGYVDDPRNTDNAWMESTAFHYHCPGQLGEQLQLSVKAVVRRMYIYIHSRTGNRPLHRSSRFVHRPRLGASARS